MKEGKDGSDGVYHLALLGTPLSIRASFVALLYAYVNGVRTCGLAARTVANALCERIMLVGGRCIIMLPSYHAECLFTHCTLSVRPSVCTPAC